MFSLKIFCSNIVCKSIALCRTDWLGWQTRNWQPRSQPTNGIKTAFSHSDGFEVSWMVLNHPAGFKTTQQFENRPDLTWSFNMCLCVCMFIRIMSICTCRRPKGWDSPYHCSAEVGLRTGQICIRTTFELLGGGCSSSLSAGFPLWWTKHA